jgi:CRP-like cAMP-binding protein
MHNKVSNYTFETMTEAELIKAPVSEILKLINSEPTLARDLLFRITSGLNSMVGRMESLVFGSAQQKVAAAVLQNARRFGKKTGQSIVISLPLTHQQLASLTGLTRETVSLEMAKFKKAAVLDYKGKTITIFNYNTLRDLSPGSI